MRNISYLFFFEWLMLCLFPNALPAQIHQLDHTPINITIAQAYPVIEEGDPIMLNITVKNLDPKASLPILLPGEQNDYKKVYYFQIYDAGAEVPELRWEESREIHLPNKPFMGPKLKILAPGEQVVFSANLNDYPRFYKAIESHHSIDAPMFAGQYKLVLIYDRSGNPIGDSLNKAHTKHGNLVLPFIVESEPITLHIRRANKEMFTFQSITYASKLRPQTRNTWDYTWDGKLVRTIIVDRDSSNAQYEAEMDATGSMAMRQFWWFPQHNIRQFEDRNGLTGYPCKFITKAYRMRTPTIWEYSYGWNGDNFCLFASFDAAGLWEYSYGYDFGSKEVTYDTYKVKNGETVPHKTRKIMMDKPFNPCDPPPSI
jgi:hypothetical protein